MFGHKKLLTEGAQAQAVIIGMAPQVEGPTILMAGAGGQHPQPNPRAGQVSAYDFTARITFDDGTTEDENLSTGWDEWTRVADSHEAESGHRFIHVVSVGPEDQAVFASLHGRLQPGQTVPVRYDAKHHKKFVLDLPALQDEMYSQAPAVRPGGSDDLSEALASGPLADILRQAAEDPEALRARLLAQSQGSEGSVVIVTGSDLTEPPQAP